MRQRIGTARTSPTTRDRPRAVVTIYRAQVLDAPEDPFRGGALRAEALQALSGECIHYPGDERPFGHFASRS